MSKAVTLLTAFGLIISLTSGCGRSTPLLTATDYELDMNTKKTNRGVAVGDNTDVYLAAYGDYRIFTSIDGSDYQVLDPDEIPFDCAVTTLLPTFFIDGLPMDPDAFCKENELAKADLLTFLSSENYLRSHSVVYYYLLFTWQNGIITDIRSEYMDYNEDVSY